VLNLKFELLNLNMRLLKKKDLVHI
jgi:hypothetical protein